MYTYIPYKIPALRFETSLGGIVIINDIQAVYMYPEELMYNIEVVMSGGLTKTYMITKQTACWIDDTIFSSMKGKNNE